MTDEELDEIELRARSATRGIARARETLALVAEVRRLLCGPNIKDICEAVREEITPWLSNNTHCDYDDFVWGLLDEAIARGIARCFAEKPPAQECSICRRIHGMETIHACE